MDEWNAFIQDSWRFKPTITVNAGVATSCRCRSRPATASTRRSTTPASAASTASTPTGSATSSRWAARRRASRRRSRSTRRRRRATTRIGTTSRRTSASRGGRTCRAASCGRCSAIPNRRRSAPGFSVTFNKAGFDEFIGIYSNNPGRTYNTNRNNGTGSEFLLVGPGETWPVLFRDKSRLGPPAGIPTSPAYPIAATTGSTISLFDPFLEVSYARTFSFGFQRARLARHGRRGPLRRHAGLQERRRRELERDEHRPERVLRGVQAGAGQPARARRGRLRPGRRGRLLVRVPRPGHGHGAAADVPRVHQRPPGGQRRQRGALHERGVDELHAPRPLRHLQPGRRRFGRRPADDRPHHQRAGGRAAVELLPHEPEHRHQLGDAARRRRREPVRLDGAAAAPAAVAGLADEPELHACVALGQRARHAAARAHLGGRRRRAACVQGHGQLGYPGRPRRAATART